MNVSWSYPEPLVVGTVTGEKNARSAVKDGAGALEFRADLIPPGEAVDMLGRISRIASDAGVPLILTLRPEAEGGRFAGGWDESAAMLRQMAGNVQVVDMELARPDLEELAGELGGLGLKVIVSHHDFEGQPSYLKLQSLVTRAMKYGDVVKISVTPSTPVQVMELYRLLVDIHGRLCVIGMGETGRQTRLLAPLFGSVLTYGYSDEPVAPGQMSVSELVNGLQLLDISGRRTS